MILAFIIVHKAKKLLHFVRHGRLSLAKNLSHTKTIFYVSNRALLGIERDNA